MSRGPYLVPGAHMGDMPMLDLMIGVLHDPLHGIHMGIAAENVARLHGITREDQDILALQSQQRAARAIYEGRFAKQIVPVEIPTRKGVMSFDMDEHVRAELPLEQLAKMKPTLAEGGTVTAGNASGLNDGASALLLATRDGIKDHGLQPIARLVAYTHAGVAPTLMGPGSIPATRLVSKRAGLTVGDLDIIESNEAFASQACALARGLGFALEKVSPNGSGISLAHSVGASGAIIATKAIHKLQRIKGDTPLSPCALAADKGSPPSSNASEGGDQDGPRGSNHDANLMPVLNAPFRRALHPWRR